MNAHIHRLHGAQVNGTIFDWASGSLPLFETSDAELTETYYFRAKAFKHQTVSA